MSNTLQIPRYLLEDAVAYLRYAGHSETAEELEDFAAALAQQAPAAHIAIVGKTICHVSTCLHAGCAESGECQAALRQQPVQAAPTPEAYDAACKALWYHRGRANEAESKLEALQAAPGAVYGWCLITGHGNSFHLGAKPPECLMQNVWKPLYTTPQTHELEALRTDLQGWIEKGEMLIDSDKFNAMFSLGNWWADRPWRKQ